MTGDLKKKIDEDDQSIPYSLHLVNLDDEETKNQLKIRNADKWAIKMHEEALVDSFGENINW